jgi:CubicO group peptidase (beta-lactamase class C family)
LSTPTSRHAESERKDVHTFTTIARRDFLNAAGRSALGCVLAPFVACAKRGADGRASRGTSTWDERIVELHARVPVLMQTSAVPGVGMAIIREGAIAWERGFGLRDRVTHVPVDTGTMFEAASMSKPVFAYAVLKLCERGVLDLDTPLVRYTRDRFLPGDARLDQITARHVLSHTAGFQDIRSRSAPLVITFTPGERWQYSGEGYAYLQSVVTELTGHVDRADCATFEAGLEVCGTDFDSYMRTNLLQPFGMRSSGYVSPDGFAAHVARAHDEKGEPLPPRAYRPPGAARYGAMGGLVTTAGDYARFLLEVMNPRPQDAVRLAPASLREMLRPQIAVEDGPGYSIAWGLGWRLAHTNDGDLASHGGDQRGFHATSEMSLARRSGYVILTNGEQGWQLIQTLAPEISRWIHA